MSVTDRDLELALRSMARIIDRYGDAYWPLFERLEAELGARRSRAARLKAHLVTAAAPPSLAVNLAEERMAGS